MVQRMVAAAVLAAVLAVAGCGGDDGGGAADGGAAQAERGSTEGAPVAPTLAEARDATGDVTFCAGKDTTGGYQDAVDRFNKRYADQGLKAKLLEFPEGSDNQREQAIQRLEARSSECDVIQADIIWVAEFASQHWMMDMTSYIEGRKDEFIPSTLAPNQYDGHYWAAPQVTGAGLLYRRTDQVPEPPATWQDLYREAADHDGMSFQGAAYEGLTCNFLELAFAAGGRVAVRRRQAGGARLAREPRRAEVHGRRRSTPARCPRASSRTWRSRPGARSRTATCRSCATGATRTRSTRRRRS